MAENKKGFILYADQVDTFKQLTNEKAGELIKHVFSYVNDEEPCTDDLIINLAFTPIKKQLQRDLDRWENTRKKRSEAGKASAEARKNKKQQNSTKPTSVKFVEQKLTPLNCVEQKLTKSTVSVNVNDNVNDISNNNTIPVTSDKPKDGIDFDNLLLIINKHTGRCFKIINKSIQAKYKARLKEGYTKKNIKDAIVNACNDPYHKENNLKYLKPDYFARANTLDLHAFKKTKQSLKHSENPYKSQL